MKSENNINDAIEMYLHRVTKNLKGVPNMQLSDIVTELRSHILDRLGSENAVATEEAVQEALETLGPPEALAEMYLTENLMMRAEKSRSPWLVMRTLFRLAIKSAWALVVFLASLIGYAVATGFLYCAVGKPFRPDRDGLWWNTKSHTLVGLGFIWPEQFDREILGWWIIPVGLLIFCLVFFLTTRFARWNIRRMRRSRRAPFTPQDALTASRPVARSLRWKHNNNTKALCLCLAALFTVPRVLDAQVPKRATPSHYSITLTPDFEKNTFGGDEFIDVHLTAPTASIQLNAAEITFEDATITNAVVTQTAKVSVDKDKELATLNVASVYESGDVTLHIRYRGVIRDSCCGFYRANAGNYRYGIMLSSARQVFPSFDDPTAKATFDIATTVAASDGAISNGRLVSDTPDANRAHHTLTFATTPRMSTYLVTIAIGQFECETGESDGVPIRVCGSPDEKGLGSEALEAAEFTLHFYDQYFETKYPYGKLDFVGLPGIPGAMENVACILSLDSILFGSRDHTSEESLKNMALGPIAHEMAHQWLGDLVTPVSEEDGWLSEGMATWMQYKPVAAWKPSWQVGLAQLLRTYPAMELDSLAGTPPVRSLDAPDQIKYDKSAAVIRMVEAYVGPAAFKKGINSYIARYAYKNASGEDLWNEITKAAKMPADRIAKGFIRQPGIPVVTLSYKCVRAKTEIVLKQNRLFSNLSNVKPITSTLWQIPVCLKLNGNTQCRLLISAEQQFVLDGCGTVFANSGARGYYQSSYDSHDLSALALDAESALSPEERLALLNDVWSQVRVGHGSVGGFLSLTEHLDNDLESSVLRLLDSDLAYLQDYIVADTDQIKFERWVRERFGMRADQAIQNSGALPTDANTELLTIAGKIGRDSPVVEFCRKITNDALNDPVRQRALVSVAFEIASRNGDDSLYDKIQSRLASSKDPSERISYIRSLAQFESPKQIRRTLSMLISTNLNVGEARALRYFLFRNQVARPTAWQFLRDHWEEFKARDLVTAGMFDDLAQFCDTEVRGQIERFFAEHKTPEFDQSLREALLRIKACEDIRIVQQPQLTSWLEEHLAGANSPRQKLHVDGPEFLHPDRPIKGVCEDTPHPI
jgi:aminopeptidase N